MDTFPPPAATPIEPGGSAQEEVSSRGWLITLEGVEGAGKTTQQGLLVDRLTVQGIPCLATREPGGTVLGRQLRDLLLHGGGLTATAELLLYAADRAEHVEQVIRPALQMGQVVICDRYTDSTLAYQGCGRGLDLQVIQDLNRIATQGVQPHLTLWLDLPVELGLQRAGDRRGLDRIEQADLDFHRRLQLGFHTLWKQFPERIWRIDAQQGVDGVHQQIWSIVIQHLPPSLRSGSE